MDNLTDRARGVSYQTLLLIGVTFGLGVAGTLFFASRTAIVSELSPLELMTFVLSVLVSGASIVLAVAAIQLGRASEDAIIRRSDESLRLQNEIFTKSMQALQRIESSTGVTEKRLEDIIAGRVGAISERVATEMAEEPSDASREEIYRSVRGALMNELSSALRVVPGQPQHPLEGRYISLRDKLVDAVAAYPEVSLVHRTPQGTLQVAGVTAVFEKSGYRWAVIALHPFNTARVIRSLLLSAVEELRAGSWSAVHVVSLFGDGDRVKRVVDDLDEPLRKKFVIHGAYAENEVTLVAEQIAANPVGEPEP